MKQRFFALCAAAVLAVCGLGLARLLGSPKAPPVTPVPSPAPDDRPVLAFFGDGADPWCAGLSDGLDAWADEEGWALITYDCKGNPTARKGQVEDLLRTETARAALLYTPGDADAAQRELLEKAGVTVVTLSLWGEADIGPGDGLGDAIADYLGTRRDVLLVADAPEDPRAQAAMDALADAALNVVEYGSCWGESGYAKAYLDGALERHPHVGAVLCLSREGAVGAGEALEAAGERDEISVLSLGPLEGPAQGQADGVLEVSREDVLPALAAALSGGAAEPLGVRVRTARADT